MNSIKVEVKAEKVSKKKLYFTKHFAKGIYGNMEVEVSFATPEMSLLVKIDGGERYIIHAKDLVQGIVKGYEKGLKSKK